LKSSVCIFLTYLRSGYSLNVYPNRNVAGQTPFELYDQCLTASVPGRFFDPILEMAVVPRVHLAMIANPLRTVLFLVWKQYAQNTLSKYAALLQFVFAIWPLMGLLPDQKTSYARVLQSLVDKSLDRRITLGFRLFPERTVVEAGVLSRFELPDIRTIFAFMMSA
jgi:hypothetical protein